MLPRKVFCCKNWILGGTGTAYILLEGWELRWPRRGRYLVKVGEGSRSPNAIPFSGSHIPPIAGTSEGPGHPQPRLPKPTLHQFNPESRAFGNPWATARHRALRLLLGQEWCRGDRVTACPPFSAVPDSIIMKVLSRRLSQQDCVQKGWVLHGFPKDLDQAHLLNSLGYQPNR